MLVLCSRFLYHTYIVHNYTLPFRYTAPKKDIMNPFTLESRYIFICIHHNVRRMSQLCKIEVPTPFSAIQDSWLIGHSQAVPLYFLLHLQTPQLHTPLSGPLKDEKQPQLGIVLQLTNSQVVRERFTVLYNIRKQKERTSTKLILEVITGVVITFTERATVAFGGI